MNDLKLKIEDQDVLDIKQNDDIFIDLYSKL